MSRSRPIARLAMIGVAAMIASCASDSGAQARNACPLTGVLESAGQQTKFRDGGSVGADVVYQARIVDMTPTACRSAPNGDAMVDLRTSVQLVRGPAAAGATDFPVTYFLAVVGPTGEVLSRDAFSVAFEVPSSRSGATSVDELTLRIPRPGAIADYRIYAALQLTTEELAYNRRTGVR